MASARIPFERLPLPLQERLSARVTRLGYLGEFFQVAAHQPQPLSHFIDFTESLKAALPARLVEIIALIVAGGASNDYELVQHQRLALKVGFSQQELDCLAAGGWWSDASFSEIERRAADVAEGVVEAGARGCTEAYGALEVAAGTEIAVGVLMTAARYLAHATMANTWQLAGPPLGEAAYV
jgi:AhpD family alkylhydroperoxidase